MNVVFTTRSEVVLGLLKLCNLGRDIILTVYYIEMT